MGNATDTSNRSDFLDEFAVENLGKASKETRQEALRTSAPVGESNEATRKKRKVSTDRKQLKDIRVVQERLLEEDEFKITNISMKESTREAVDVVKPILKIDTRVFVDVALRYFINNLEHFDLEEVRKGEVPALLHTKGLEPGDQTENEPLTSV